MRWFFFTIQKRVGIEFFVASFSFLSLSLFLSFASFCFAGINLERKKGNSAARGGAERERSLGGKSEGRNINTEAMMEHVEQEEEVEQEERTKKVNQGDLSACAYRMRPEGGNGSSEIRVT